MSDDDDYEFKAEQAKAEWYEDEKDEHDRAGILAAMSAEAADDDAYRSVNGFIQVPKHQASLRTRIAAAIYDGMNEWDRKYAIDPRNSALTPELKAEITCFKLADAVIRELGLTRRTGQGPYSNQVWYQTDWSIE